MTWIMWASLVVIAVLVIFAFGFMVGEGFEFQESTERNKRLAERERRIRAWQREIDKTLREIDMMNRAPLDRVGDLEIIDLHSRVIPRASRGKAVTSEQLSGS